jgi:hypothetical protein
MSTASISAGTAEASPSSVRRVAQVFDDLEAALLALGVFEAALPVLGGRGVGLTARHQQDEAHEQRGSEKTHGNTPVEFESRGRVYAAPP